MEKKKRDHATYAKSLDEKQMKFESESIIKPLKKLVGKNAAGRTYGLKLPNYITFSIDNKCLSMYLRDVVTDKGRYINYAYENMQTDNAAFEGWAIVLKSWLGDRIETVIFDWDDYKEQKPVNNPHYNRFLYRCVRFSEIFDWFSVSTKKENVLKEFMKGYNNLSINFSSKESDKKSNNENAVEYEIVDNDNPTNRNVFMKQFDLKLLSHALPVGIKSNGKQLFTGRQSAIDIWGITNSDLLDIFELKYIEDGKSKNIKVGIISELFFYACLMLDLKNGLIKPAEAILEDQIYLYKNVKSLKGINAFMLANEYHPLVNSDKVIELLNESTTKVGISFRKIFYEYNKGTYNLTIR